MHACTWSTRAPPPHPTFRNNRSQSLQTHSNIQNCPTTQTGYFDRQQIAPTQWNPHGGQPSRNYGNYYTPMSNGRDNQTDSSCIQPPFTTPNNNAHTMVPSYSTQSFPSQSNEKYDYPSANEYYTHKNMQSNAYRKIVPSIGNTDQVQQYWSQSAQQNNTRTASLMNQNTISGSSRGMYSQQQHQPPARSNQFSRQQQTAHHFPQSTGKYLQNNRKRHYPLSERRMESAVNASGVTRNIQNNISPESHNLNSGTCNANQTLQNYKKQHQFDNEVLMDRFVSSHLRSLLVNDYSPEENRQSELAFQGQNVQTTNITHNESNLNTLKTLLRVKALEKSQNCSLAQRANLNQNNCPEEIPFQQNLGCKTRSTQMPTDVNRLQDKIPSDLNFEPLMTQKAPVQHSHKAIAIVPPISQQPSNTTQVTDMESRNIEGSLKITHAMSPADNSTKTLTFDADASRNDKPPSQPDVEQQYVSSGNQKKDSAITNNPYVDSSYRVECHQNVSLQTDSCLRDVVFDLYNVPVVENTLGKLVDLIKSVEVEELAKFSPLCVEMSTSSCNAILKQFWNGNKKNVLESFKTFKLFTGQSIVSYDQYVTDLDSVVFKSVDPESLKKVTNCVLLSDEICSGNEQSCSANTIEQLPDIDTLLSEPLTDYITPPENKMPPVSNDLTVASDSFGISPFKHFRQTSFTTQDQKVGPDTQSSDVPLFPSEGATVSAENKICSSDEHFEVCAIIEQKVPDNLIDTKQDHNDLHSIPPMFPSEGATVSAENKICSSDEHFEVCAIIEQKVPDNLIDIKQDHNDLHSIPPMFPSEGATVSAENKICSSDEHFEVCAIIEQKVPDNLIDTKQDHNDLHSIPSESPSSESQLEALLDGTKPTEAQKEDSCMKETLLTTANEGSICDNQNMLVPPPVSTEHKGVTEVVDISDDESPVSIEALTVTDLRNLEDITDEEDSVILEISTCSKSSVVESISSDDTSCDESQLMEVTVMSPDDAKAFFHQLQADSECSKTEFPQPDFPDLFSFFGSTCTENFEIEEVTNSICCTNPTDSANYDELSSKIEDQTAEVKQIIKEVSEEESCSPVKAIDDVKDSNTGEQRNSHASHLEQEPNTIASSPERTKVLLCSAEKERNETIAPTTVTTTLPKESTPKTSSKNQKHIIDCLQVQPSIVEKPRLHHSNPIPNKFASLKRKIQFPKNDDNVLFVPDIVLKARSKSEAGSSKCTDSEILKNDLIKKKKHRKDDPDRCSKKHAKKRHKDKVPYAAICSTGNEPQKMNSILSLKTKHSTVVKHVKFKLYGSSQESNTKERHFKAPTTLTIAHSVDVYTEPSAKQKVLDQWSRTFIPQSLSSKRKKKLQPHELLQANMEGLKKHLIYRITNASDRKNIKYSKKSI